MKKMKWLALVPLSFALLIGCQQDEPTEKATAAPKEEKKVAVHSETAEKMTNGSTKEANKADTKKPSNEELDVSRIDKDFPLPSSNQYQSEQAITTIENGAYATMSLYLEGIAKAVTEDDYSQVMPYITPNRPIADSTQLRISDLNSKHTSEELVEFNLNRLKKTGSSPEGDDYVLQTHEVYLLSNEDTNKRTLEEYDSIYSATLLPSHFFRLNVTDKATHPVSPIYSESERKKLEQNGLPHKDEQSVVGVNLSDYDGFWSDANVQTPVQVEFKSSGSSKAQVKVNYGTESTTNWQDVLFTDGMGFINYLTDGTGTSGNITIELKKDLIETTIETSSDSDNDAIPSGVFTLTKQ